MPDATITSTASTFGTISGVFSSDQSTITGTITGVVVGTLDGSVGVPGPQGPAGATGPQGPAGAAGVGVPAGGTTGQVLAKSSNTDYATAWTTLSLTQYLEKANNLSDLTNFTTARDNLGLGASGNPLFNSLSINTNIIVDATDNGEGIQFGTRGIQTIPFPGFNDAALTGNPTAPTPSIGDDDTSIATTAFVKSQNYAPLASPVFTGNPTAPTAAFGDNDTSIATTAFVQAGLLGGTANARNLEVYVRNQSGSTIPAGSIVYISGATGNRPLITLAQANNDANSAQTIGFVKTSIANNGFGYVIVRGELENIDTSALTEGVQLYLSPTVAGSWTTTKPSAPQHLVYVGIVIRSHPTLGVILVAVQNGYELEELHDVAIGTLANNDLLAYESSTDLWKNKTFSALGLLTSADAASTYLTQANAASTYQTQAGMSSYLTTSTAASTYAPIASPTFTGTVTIPAGASISGYATLASPTFTGTPSLPTGTTAVTQAAGNNTTAVATTAFVLANAGSPTYSTIPQALAGTSTTTALNPFNVNFAEISAFIYAPVPSSLTSVTSGGGASSMNSYGGGLNSSSANAGYVLRHGSPYQRSVNISSGIQWQKPQMFAIRLTPYFAFQSASIFRMTLGSSTATLNVLSARGIGISFGASAANTFLPVVLSVHNGTTLTTVTSSFTPTLTQGFDVVVYSDGTGNVTLYINDAQVATTSAGPSTAAGANLNILQLGIENTTTLTTGSNVAFGSLKTFIS